MRLIVLHTFWGNGWGTWLGRKNSASTRTKTIKVILANALGCCCSIGDDNVSRSMIYGRIGELSQLKVIIEIYVTLR